jgi:hypothetical protein
MVRHLPRFPPSQSRAHEAKNGNAPPKRGGVANGPYGIRTSLLNRAF